MFEEKSVLLSQIPEDELFNCLYFDNSPRKSGKQGIAITPKRVTWREDETNNYPLSWGGFNNIKINSIAKLELNTDPVISIDLSQADDYKRQIIADLIMLLHALWKKYGK
jgi:hypothetical protein